MATALPLTPASEGTEPTPKSDLRFALFFATAVATLSLLPYLLAYAMTPSGHHFAGFFFIADDAATYLAKMRQGAAGAWTWNDPYTSEPHGGVFLFGFYLFFGHLSALLHLPLIATYHLASISGGFALVLSTERLARRVLHPQFRRLALVLVVLGSGVGFIAQILGDPSVLGHRVEALDLHLPELSGFYSILAVPHFAWATALIVLSLLGLLQLMETPRWQTVVGTGALMTVLTAIHPQMIPVIFLIWLAHQAVLVSWGGRPGLRSVGAQLAAFLLTLPLLAYNAWILYRDPTIAEWARQWRHQAPGPISLALGLGLPLVAATAGIIVAWRRRDRGLALLMVWPPLVIVRLYAPNLANIQRRLLDALYVPIGLLAAIGLRALIGRLHRINRRRLERTLVPAFCFSSAIVLAIALRFASGAFPEAYVRSDAWQAMRWLETHHDPGDRVLSSPQAGLLLPAWSGTPVYVGHYSETLDYFGKIATVGRMLQPGVSDSELRSFLAGNRLTLLYWGPDESRGTTFNPTSHPYLRPIYRAGEVTIYRVVAD